MADTVDIDALRAAVTKQAGLVRQLKAEGAPAADIQKAVEELKAMRTKLDEVAKDEEGGVSKWAVNKRALEDCMLRRMFVVPSFEIHGGVAGLFDYGPPGCALKENMLALWRQHFVLEDGLLQIECTTLTPYAVLKTSGHVDKFEDLMVKDVKTGECYRADKLLEDVVDNMLTLDKTLTTARREELRKIHAQAGSYNKEQIALVFQDLNIKAPATGNDLTAPFQFNLMFQTSIGPTGTQLGFLRPETAQGMFVNFRRLYEYANQRMPIGVAQIGSAYRNEIAPRGGLLRVREFTMAEIEFFVHPDQKDHVKFDSVKSHRLTLFPGVNQVGNGKTVSPTLEEAVSTGVINNQTLAYFMARTAAFLLRAGIKPEGLRFRQHLKTEMAHYACDCWDAEILMSTGWVECVGIADRSAYDLQVHSKASKVDLVAREFFNEPREEDFIIATRNNGLMGKTFKGDNAAVTQAINELVENVDAAVAFQAQLDANGSAELKIAEGKSVTITSTMLKMTKERRKVSERKYTPNVIEPSFGIGRIITGILEHNFSVREGDEQRAVLSFKPIVAPYKVCVLLLDSRLPKPMAASMVSSFVQAGVSATFDESGVSIGKRYSRADEVGIPFAITIDHQTLIDGNVTVRERDTCAQVRVPMDEVQSLVKGLCDESMQWASVLSKYPVVTTGEDKAATATQSDAPVQPVKPAQATIGGSVGVVLEGSNRLYGKFMRPATI